MPRTALRSISANIVVPVFNDRNVQHGDHSGFLPDMSSDTDLSGSDDDFDEENRPGSAPSLLVSNEIPVVEGPDVMRGFAFCESPSLGRRLHY